MKYYYSDSKFLREDKIGKFQSPLAYFIETPILSFSKEALVKIGTIDLSEAKEYVMPIQIGRVLLKKMLLFKEHVGFVPSHYGENNFVRSEIQILTVDKTYNPYTYKWQDVVFEYILLENFEYFINTIIPFINWGLYRHQNDIDIILLFATLLCKREHLETKKDFKHSYPFLSKYFLNDITVKQNFHFQSRVGRDDHAYEYTHFIYEPKYAEEHYFLRLMAKELAEKSFSPIFSEKINGKKIDISYCSMYDNNAYRESDREYTEEECNVYKNKIVEKHGELYFELFEKFEAYFNDFIKYQCNKKYDEVECESIIKRLNEKIEVLEAKSNHYNRELIKHGVPFTAFDEHKFLSEKER